MKSAPVMVINDVPYAERKAHAPSANSPAGACLQCAFFADAPGCWLAVGEGKAAAAFGGDCVQRNVVYAFANARRAA